MTGKSRTTSIILKLIVVISAIVGTILSAYAGRNSFMGGTRVFMYFTIQSNIALAIICLVGAILLIRKVKINRLCQVIKFVGTISITLTGVVFCFVLAPTMGIHAWNIQNILTHVVVPLVSIADFFLAGTKYQYKLVDVLWVIVPPIIYAIYAGIGYVNNWKFSEYTNYPYFFLNWGSEAGAFGFSKELPFMGCAWWILALLIFLLLIGCLYLKVLKTIKKKIIK